MMNERIRELMIEAGYAAPELASRGQHLAELIIEDCINIIEKDAPWSALYVKQHFGIEE